MEQEQSPGYHRRALLLGGAATAGLAGLSIAQEPRTDPAGVAGYGYRLPAFDKGSRLVFIGDSITDMKWGRKESDRNHYLGHSFVYLIMARLGVELAAAELDVYNRGISGHTIADLRKRWQKDAIDMKPDLLSILVGANDAGRNVSPTDYETDYRAILSKSRAANPQLRLVLLDPFLLPTGRLSDQAAFKKRMKPTAVFGGIVARLAAEFQAVHVKTQDVFDTAAKAAPAKNWIWDGVHPLPQGHELIARNWLQAVSGRWPG